MVKRLSMLALAGLMVLPAVASAGGGKSKADLERKVEELSRQLDELKAQMAQQNEAISQYGDKVDDMDPCSKKNPKNGIWPPASSSTAIFGRGGIITRQITYLLLEHRS